MGWLGKLTFGTIGFALAGPLGAIAGAAFGHSIDSKEESILLEEREYLSTHEEVQLIFFVAAFSMLAKLAKADGRVCEKEILSVKQFMENDLQLNSESKRVAENIFREALLSEESFESFARQFYKNFSTQYGLIEIMLDVLIRVSLADGDFSEDEERLILSAVEIFRFRSEDYLKIKSKYILRSDSYHAVLGCDRSDSNEFVKKQYRKLVVEYHPDKIASKGMPEEFEKFSEAKFREIQEAYEVVCKERGIK